MDPVEPAGLRAPYAPVPFAQATWTSSDRFDRYGAIVRLLRAQLGAGTHRVLDVGDAAGHLALFDDGLEVVGLDPTVPDGRLPGARVLQGDGTALPFPDATFDAVVSSDVLEHVPDELRPALLGELGRVSRDVVIVAAPFDTPGVAGAEELVRRYARLVLGSPQPQLEEHHERGLPSLDRTVELLGASATDVAAFGNGNLVDWVLSMLLRFQVEARPALGPLVGGYDRFHNEALADQARRPPHYRHVIVARTAGRVAGGDEPPAGGGEVDGAQLAALVGAILAADVSEVVRQDVTGTVLTVAAPQIERAVVERLEPIVHGTREILEGAAELGRAESSAHAERLAVELARLRDQQLDDRARLEELIASQAAANAPVVRLQTRIRAARDRVRRLAGRG